MGNNDGINDCIEELMIALFYSARILLRSPHATNEPPRALSTNGVTENVAPSFMDVDATCEVAVVFLSGGDGGALCTLTSSALTLYIPKLYTAVRGGAQFKL